VPSLLLSKFKIYYGRLIYELSKRYNIKYDRKLSISNIQGTYHNYNDQYYYFHHYFWNKAPQWLRDHRSYFKSSLRGFGEDAFHAMWYLIFQELKPELVLEIGVYRGQVTTLWSLLAKNIGYEINIHAISPFSYIGDGVTTYRHDIDYYRDVINNYRYFDLKVPKLHKGFSLDKEMIDIISLQKWDIIYIDGNHDYEVVKKDFNNCRYYLKNKGLIVLDDASLFTDYRPWIFCFPGHPGPSKVADEIDKNEFKEILSCGHNRVFQKLI